MSSQDTCRGYSTYTCTVLISSSSHSVLSALLRADDKWASLLTLLASYQHTFMLPCLWNWVLVMTDETESAEFAENISSNAFATIKADVSFLASAIINHVNWYWKVIAPCFIVNLSLRERRTQSTPFETVVARRLSRATIPYVWAYTYLYWSHCKLVHVLVLHHTTQSSINRSWPWGLFARFLKGRLISSRGTFTQCFDLRRRNYQ